MKRTMEERFWSKVEKGGLWDCWEWIGFTGPSGHARFHVGAGTVAAHRLAYEWANGPIPEGLVLDHMCGNPACVNPVHLEAVSVRENNRRGPNTARSRRVPQWTPLRRPLTERFWEKVDRGSDEECWEWTAATNRSGYGTFAIGRRPRLAYRVAYEWAKGTVPKGLVLDHLCRNRACVNPAHLEAVSQRENVKRGLVGKYVGPRDNGFCYQGHALVPGNIRVEPNGVRCLACAQERNRKHREKDREVYNAKALVHARRYKENNREKLREKQQQYKEKDPERFRAMKKISDQRYREKKRAAKEAQG